MLYQRKIEKVLIFKSDFVKKNWNHSLVLLVKVDV